MRHLTDACIIAGRDLLRAKRQKTNLVNALVRPILWLFVLGAGLKGGFAALLGGVNLQQYIFPGVIAMNVAFAGVMSGSSIIWDREFGFLKEIMVAPVSRISIVLGKLFSGSLVAFFHGLVVLLFYPLLGLKPGPAQLALTLTAVFLVSLTVTSLGILLAVRMRSIEGFGTINNFLVMPMFFLSGAMFPPENIPGWLKYLTVINPLTYGVDLIRGTILGLQGNFLFDLLVLLYLTLLMLVIAVKLFEQSG